MILFDAPVVWYSVMKMTVINGFGVAGRGRHRGSSESIAGMREF